MDTSIDNPDKRNLEQLYNDMILSLREDLVKCSGIQRIPMEQRIQVLQSLKKTLAELPSSSRVKRIPFRPRDPELQKLAHLLPDSQPPYAGFQLIDVVRIGSIALIGFTWVETGNQIFVYSVDLHPYTEPFNGDYSIIITTLLLEQLGDQWYSHHTLKTINGLTFFE